MATENKNGFFNLHSHGFARVAVAVPKCRIADPSYNAAQTIELAKAAAAEGAVLVTFPELGLSAYTCEDLFHQQALLTACETALDEIVVASMSIEAALVVGTPMVVGGQLFNCAAVIARGELLGVIPKSYLPNYGEFYEARQFSSGDNASADSVTWKGRPIPFGSQQLFQLKELAGFVFHVEICEDVWVPIPPSSFAALAGATVLVNLSASNALVGKSGYRNDLVGQQSARCLAAYLYASAGDGESTNDLAWDGHSMIYEKGEKLAETQRFAQGSQIISADIDVERVLHDRIRTTTFSDSIRRHQVEIAKFRRTIYSLAVDLQTDMPLKRIIERFPYVPADKSVRDNRCTEVFNIQAQALAQRLSTSNISKVVIGVSGGLDSTHALLVCAAAMDRLGLPRSNILGYTMPGFATSGRTLEQAHALMKVMGCSVSEIDIRPSCIQMLKDLGHPFAEGKEQYDITFENVQAGERTNHLFRLANYHGALVVGTGDLSELALGWCTYGVGDHMSHYNVNGSVPKTLISYLVRWLAEGSKVDPATSEVLLNILGTEISPELVPSQVGQDAAPAQSTESSIGPYELQDFTLFYVLRYGFSPAKIAFLAHSAWKNRDNGEWPNGVHIARNQYELSEIKKNLRTFMHRFFKTSQFKRTCVPNGPKVGNGGSLSPRGDWRAPSDGEAVVWLANLAQIPD